MSKIRSQVQELYYAISADIEHGECFYDYGMLTSFLKNLDKMQKLAVKLYEENQREDDE